jgi:hypothetical protein
MLRRQKLVGQCCWAAVASYFDNVMEASNNTPKVSASSLFYYGKNTMEIIDIDIFFWDTRHGILICNMDVKAIFSLCGGFKIKGRSRTISYERGCVVRRHRPHLDQLSYILRNIHHDLPSQGWGFVQQDNYDIRAPLVVLTTMSINDLYAEDNFLRKIRK